MTRHQHRPARRAETRQARRASGAGSGVVPPGEIEIDLGVPVPGVILPPERWSRTALKKLPPDKPLDWPSLFGRHAPRVVDLGCGNGRFAVSSAVRRPELDHLGIDVLPVVIRYATRRGNQRGLTNVRFAVCGAREFLERLAEPGTLDEIHLYHPQPHPRPGRNKRLVTPEFLALVERALVPGGRFYFQTDNLDYWKQTLGIVSDCLAFYEQREPWPDDPQGRTRREIIARRKGLPIFRGWGEKPSRE